MDQLQDTKGPEYEAILDFLQPEAFLYFPPENTHIQGKDQKVIRWYFEGNIQFRQNQLKYIQDFKIYVNQKGDKNTLQNWKDASILQFLYGNGLKQDQTLASIQEHNIWKSQMFPLSLTEDISSFLESGIMYLSGQDHRFRPIIVFNAYKINPQVMDDEKLITGITYFLEMVLKYHLLPGQIENWVLIMDLNGVGMTSLPMGTIQQIITYLQGNYRARLYRFYSVNSPGSLTFTWSAIKVFLDQRTNQKIKFVKGSVPELLFEHANQSQVEIRFGGQLENQEKDFWPPSPIQGDIFKPDEKINDILITQQEYKKQFENKLLDGCKINEKFV